MSSMRYTPEVYRRGLNRCRKMIRPVQFQAKPADTDTVGGKGIRLALQEYGLSTQRSAGCRDAFTLFHRVELRPDAMGGILLQPGSTGGVPRLQIGHLRWRPASSPGASGR